MEGSNDKGGAARRLVFTRRSMFEMMGGGMLLAAGAGPSWSQTAPWAHHGEAVLQKARSQGLVVWHGDQEEDVVKFVAKFSEATGVPAKQFRLLPGAALPRLEAELRMKRSDVDIYLCADPGLMDQLRARGQLMRYNSPELAAYPKQLKSDPEGFWTTYYLYFGPMMYSPSYVAEADAPKTWLDLLDPRWAGQVGFQNSSAGSQYGWWYVLKDVLPKDYWDRLGMQKPRAYASSTQIVNDIFGGKLKIGGKVNAFQYVKASRKGIPAKAVFPTEGTPAGYAAAGIIGATKRAEASMIFMDYLLSRQGQFELNNTQGSPSARSDVSIPDVPSMKDVKTLLPVDFSDFQSGARHAEFVSLWNRIMGA